PTLPHVGPRSWEITINQGKYGFPSWDAKAPRVMVGIRKNHGCKPKQIRSLRDFGGLAARACTQQECGGNRLSSGRPARLSGRAGIAFSGNSFVNYPEIRILPECGYRA